MNTIAADTPTDRRGLLDVSKSRAFVVHLSASAVVVGTLCAIIFVLWHPAPYFTAKGASDVLRVLIGVDLVLGPALTLILFKPRKPRLLFDLSVIVVIQLAALIYGTTVIYEERPYYSVFAVDRFEVLAYGDADSSLIENEELRRKPFVGPILAVASLPEDPVTFQRLLQETVSEGKPDIEHRPEFWSPYASRSADVLARARALADLAEEKPAAQEEVSRLTESLNLDIAELGYLPLVGKDRSFVVVIDSETAGLVDIIDVNPWDETS
jgi:hypothetical protein